MIQSLAGIGRTLQGLAPAFNALWFRLPLSVHRSIQRIPGELLFLTEHPNSISSFSYQLGNKFFEIVRIIFHLMLPSGSLTVYQ